MNTQSTLSKALEPHQASRIRLTKQLVSLLQAGQVIDNERAESWINSLSETQLEQKRAFEKADLQVLFESVLLWNKYEEAGGRVHVDTFGSQFLTRFPLVNKVASTDIHQYFQQHAALSMAEMTEVAEDINFAISNLAIKHQVAEALAARVQLGYSALALFDNLFAADALTSPELLDTVICDTGIFFIYDDKRLAEGGYEQQKAALKKFLEELALEHPNARAHFPAVGKMDMSSMDPELLNFLCAAVNAAGEAQVSEMIVRQTLETMCYLLPNSQAESFLVHDTWGHGWQEGLLDFEHYYDYLESLPSPSMWPDLLKLLDSREAKNQVDSTLAAAQEFLLEDFCKRIDVAINAIMSEFTADIMELPLQLILEKEGNALPTSSLCQAFGSFLDLTLMDIKKHLSSVRLAYLTLVEQLEDARSIDSKIVVELSTWIRKTLLKEVNTESPYDESSPTIRDHIVSELLGVYSIVNSCSKTKPQLLHLLTFSLSLYYQQNRTVHFWQLEDFTARIVPAIEDFGALHISA